MPLNEMPPKAPTDGNGAFKVDCAAWASIGQGCSSQRFCHGVEGKSAVCFAGYG
jgi:hypothetical protein